MSNRRDSNVIVDIEIKPLNANLNSYQDEDGI